MGAYGLVGKCAPCWYKTLDPPVLSIGSRICWRQRHTGRGWLDCRRRVVVRGGRRSRIGCRDAITLPDSQPCRRLPAVAGGCRRSAGVGVVGGCPLMWSPQSCGVGGGGGSTEGGAGTGPGAAPLPARLWIRRRNWRFLRVTRPEPCAMCL